MNLKRIRNIFILLLMLLIFAVETCHGKSLQIDSPLKAAVFYFPSSATMRCLNHSDIPRNFRKGVVSKKIQIPGDKIIEQTITIGIDSISPRRKRFILKGNIKEGENKEVFILKLKNYPFFNQNEHGEKIPAFFGFENLLGLQRRVHVKDKIGNQELDYEVFLKTTKGKIGGLKYELNLFGQDRVADGTVRYFLDGQGKIGNYLITATGREIQKDYYEISEQYGPIKIFTTIRVYD